MGGKYSETVGKDKSGTILYSGSTLEAHCLVCPAGFNQAIDGRAYCLPCLPGTRQVYLL